MVKKIRAMLDYGCYPIWLYDENDNLIDTLLPEELRNDQELDSMFDDLQARYEQLFINNEYEFSYVGFDDAQEQQAFLRDWSIAVNELRNKADPMYEIIDEIAKTFD